MSLKESIGWTDRTCNPIKGKCKGGCWYCYTYPMYKMGRLTEPIRLELSVFDKLPKFPRKIFICSTHELFGGWIPKDWRDKIFEKMEDFPQHTFQILTKMPENIDRPMPDNVWLGVSSTGYPTQQSVFAGLNDSQARIKFISFEPLLTPILLGNWFRSYHFNWIIAGRLTGHGKKHDPKREWIQLLIKEAEVSEIPIFLKNNLKEIWGGKLIQEFPE